MLKILYLIPILALTACQTTNAISESKTKGKHVKATWYGVGDKPNKHTANGEVFKPYGHTVAHKTLPFHTHLKITNPRNGRYIVARVNDRGPFVRGIELDLTKGSANAIGMSGTQTVIMERLEKR